MFLPRKETYKNTRIPQFSLRDTKNHLPALSWGGGFGFKRGDDRLVGSHDIEVQGEDAEVINVHAVVVIHIATEERCHQTADVYSPHVYVDDHAS